MLQLFTLTYLTYFVMPFHTSRMDLLVLLKWYGAADLSALVMTENCWVIHNGKLKAPKLTSASCERGSSGCSTYGYQ